MDNRFVNFTIIVLKLNKFIHKIKLYEMEEYGLKAVHVMCVYQLGERGPLTLGQLSKLTCEDKGALCRALAILREKGFVVSENKRYRNYISLTEKGKELAQHINRKAAEAVDKVGADLTEEDREVLYKALGSITANLEKYYESISAKRERD